MGNIGQHIVSTTMFIQIFGSSLITFGIECPVVIVSALLIISFKQIITFFNFNRTGINITVGNIAIFLYLAAEFDLRTVVPQNAVIFDGIVKDILTADICSTRVNGEHVVVNIVDSGITGNRTAESYLATGNGI